MSVSIPDSVLEAAHMRVDEFLLEVAVMLFSKEKLTLAQAARLAHMDRLSFPLILIARAFEKSGIEIAFPQRDIHFDESKPLRVELSRARDDKSSDASDS